MKKRVLILGNSACVYVLAKRLSDGCDVFVAPGADTMRDFAEIIDIREDSSKELLEFVLENQIDLTIPVSVNSINSDLVSLFTSNKQPVFGPSKNASEIIRNKPLAKKTMYKLRIPTPKFGIFDKENSVYEYLKNQPEPFVIKTSDSNSATVLMHSQSKNILNGIFAQKNEKLLVEDFISGTPLSFYAVTDGYKALPIGSSIVYRHSLNGDGGQLTSGMGACSPNYKLSSEQEYFIMNDIIYPVLYHIESQNDPYVGIIGINGILEQNGNIQVLGFEHFMQDSDAQCVINSLDENLYNLFYSCAIGAFSDEFNEISLNNTSSVSVVLRTLHKNQKFNIINGLDNLEEDTNIAFFNTIKKNKYLEYEINNVGSAVSLTCSGGNISQACAKVYKEIENINFEGKCYRTDICTYKNSTDSNF